MELIIILISFAIAVATSLIIKRRAIVEFFSITTSLIMFIESFSVALKVADFGTYAPSSFFSVDALGAITLLVVACVGFATTVYSVAYFRKETAKHIIGLTRVRQYFILLGLFLLAMVLAITTSSPIFAWIAIEATTLSTAFLISFYNKPSAMEAAWKYLIINSIGLLLAFFGTLLYFTSMHSLANAGFVTWQALGANTVTFDPLIAKIAFIFVIIGYGTKVGFAPIHTWKPDAYSKTPAPLGALFSGALLPVAFITILKFKVITDFVVGPAFSSNLLIAFGILSIIVAAFIIFISKNYKRVLAYSSIENSGIMALGFGFGGLGVFAAILHLIYHSFIKSTLFFSSGSILLKYNSAKISDIKGAFRALPVTSVLFLIAFFIITGMPPFGIFLSKILILSAGITLHPVIVISALLLMAILFIGFFKHVTQMVFGEAPSEITPGEDSIWLTIPSCALIITTLYLSFHMPAFLHKLLIDATMHY